MFDILKKIGLEDTDAKIYLSLLQLGPSTATEISRKAGISRTLSYHALEKLGWLGLVNRASGKRKKLQFFVEHPKNLVQFVKDKKNVWEG